MSPAAVHRTPAFPAFRRIFAGTWFGTQLTGSAASVGVLTAPTSCKSSCSKVLIGTLGVVTTFLATAAVVAAAGVVVLTAGDEAEPVQPGGDRTRS